MEKTGATCIVRYVQDTIDAGKVVEEKGPYASRNVLQTVTLLDAIEEFKFDAALGGGRRDEEKARAKERFFSHRDEFGQWDPKNQRPELWNIFNGRKHVGEHFRVFPLSNWTELDVWQYIYLENIEIPSLYFTHEREMILRDGVLLPHCPYIMLKSTDKIVKKQANTIEDIIREVAVSQTTERGTRWDDKRSESAMEDRKREGYF